MPGSESEGTHLQGSVWVAVPAAGSGARMGGATPKQYLPLAGKPLAVHTLTALLAVKGIREIVVAIAPADSHWSKLPALIRARVRVVDGGPTRAVSVLNALRGFSVTPDPDDWVLVHDMARPCVRPERIVAMVRELACDAVGGLLAVPLVDTLKRADEAQRVTATLGREALWRAQTPQMFRFGLLQRALDEAIGAGVEATDEAMAIERLGLRPRLLLGSEDNIKVTCPEDVLLAEFHLNRYGAQR